MLLFELISEEPLEPHSQLKYNTFACDGDSMAFLEVSGSRIIRHNRQQQFLDEHPAARAYHSICYDDADQCFWGCSSKCNNAIYKLSATFKEVDRFVFCGYDTCLGEIKSIAYDRWDDCLILTYASRVITVEKHSFTEREVKHYSCNHTCLSCIRSCRYHYYLTRHCGTEMLSIAENGQVLIHCALPVGHRVLGMAEVCTGRKPFIYFLSIKHGAYYYLLKGILVHRHELHADAVHQCLGFREKKPTECCQEHTPPHEICTKRRLHTGRRYRVKHCQQLSTPVVKNHHCHFRHWEDNCHHSHYGQNSSLSRWDLLVNSCTSIIESIALEQTAISHILNAEGEKIQRVIAVSDRPADFLDVNQSVLEVITKVTHLEQVLFSKLELSCEALREAKAE